MVGMNTSAARRRAIEAAQWVAARELSEGAPGTRRRVAAALGCDVSSLYGRAASEGWRCVNFRGRPRKEAWEEFIRVAHAERDGDVAHEVMGAGADEGDWAEQGDVSASAFERVAQAVGSGAVDAAGGAGDGREGAGDTVAGETGDAEADDPGAMLARGARFLSRRLSRLMRLAERGGAISKTEIDNLTAMTRMMDRWETLAKERATNEETGRDGKIAEALRKIDRRILTLARAEAERLVAAGGAEGDRGRDR